MEITTESIQIPLEGGGAMGGYLARPKSGERRPAVLVFMEIFGINSHIREVTERLAREGYVALAPDYFHRTGPGIELGYDEAGFAEGFKHLNALKADQMVSDARTAITWLRSRKDVRGDRIGCMGFCIGGHMTYLAAAETDVLAAASFYGGGIAAAQGPGGQASTISRSGEIRGRIVCLFGDQDEYIPDPEVEAIRTALREGDVDHEVVVYPGAQHGFFCDQRASYRKPAAEDAWKRVKTLFAKALG